MAFDRARLDLEAEAKWIRAQLGMDRYTPSSTISKGETPDERRAREANSYHPQTAWKQNAQVGSALLSTVTEPIGTLLDLAWAPAWITASSMVNNAQKGRSLWLDSGVPPPFYFSQNFRNFDSLGQGQSVNGRTGNDAFVHQYLESSVSIAEAVPVVLTLTEGTIALRAALKRGGIGLAEGAAQNGPAANRAQFEQLKDQLRQQMGKPAATDSKLASHLDQLYRADAKIGSGSTADAIRHELRTGQPVGGVWHSQKGKDSITFLEKWLTTNPTARPGDRAAAENVIKDIQNALGTP